HDDPVVDADDRPVADRMVVGGDRRVALRVVAHMDERVRRRAGHRDALQQVAPGRPLLPDRREGLAPRAGGGSPCVRASLRDAGQQGLSSERSVDVRFRPQAVAGYSTHSFRNLWRRSSFETYGSPRMSLYPYRRFTIVTSS